MGSEGRYQPQGRYQPGSAAVIAHQPKDENSDRPGYSFGNDLSVRPWLFGNWWKARLPNDPLQLMGLGVRLAATPDLEDAEGNGPERATDNTLVVVHYHGSYLRVRTDDGRCIAAAT